MPSAHALNKSLHNTEPLVDWLRRWFCNNPVHRVLNNSQRKQESCSGLNVTMDTKKRLFFLNNDNVICTSEQENCCEIGGIGARYFKCMQLYQDNIAQIDAESGKIETYSTLFQKSVRTAIEMKNLGVAQKDVVSICSGNHMDVSVPFIAAMFLGAVTVNMDVNMSPEEMALFVEKFAPKIIFASEDVGHKLHKILEQAKKETVLVVFGSEEFDAILSMKVEEGAFRPLPIQSIDDTAHIFLSSGTTGAPKGVKISHKALLNQTEKLISDGRDAKYLDVMLYFASMYWISSAWMITVAVTLGTTRLIAKSFDPFKTWCYIDKYKVTYAYMLPRMLIQMENTTCPSSSKTQSLRLLVTAGEFLSPDVLLRLRAKHPNTIIVQGYGSTESAGVISVFRINDPEDVALLKNKPSSCGRPVAGLFYKILDINTGIRLGLNQSGELRIKSPYLMSGYHNEGEKSAFDEDGWLKTGDVVSIDEDFCFTVMDRLSEIIDCKGWFVSPTTIEAIVETHPAVEKAVVVGVPQKEGDGQKPTAFVSIKRGYETISKNEIEAFANERVDEKSKLSGGVRFVKEFPLTHTGKISRKHLKDTLLF